MLEERRLRVDNAPLGRWQEGFARASLTNNYGWVGGWAGGRVGGWVGEARRGEAVSGLLC